MPIKLPRGFPRRKSSGNVLDEPQDAEPSFKVYSRPASSSRSLNLMTTGKSPEPIRKNSYGHEDEDLFTVARPTHVSRSNKSLPPAPYDSGASSFRLSTSSTNPSSVDMKSDKAALFDKQRSFDDIPIPPPHQQRAANFLRNAGHTFSFGAKSPRAVPIPEPELPPPPPPVSSSRYGGYSPGGRQRAMTTSSSTDTATPPRLIDSDLILENSELDTFGKMFDTISVGSSRDASPTRQSPVQMLSPNINAKSYTDTNGTVKPVLPRPLIITKSGPIASPPYSTVSEASKDGLMRSPSPSKADVTPYFSPQQESMRQNRAVRSTTFDNFVHRPNAHQSVTQHQPRLNSLRPNSHAAQDTFTGSQPVPSTFAEQTKHLLGDEQDESLFDPTLLADARVMTKYQETKHKAVEPAKRVMTPKEFEKYKQQQNDRRRMNKVFGKVESDDSGDDYEDDIEDEAERDRKAFTQRRKQEAHLAVYRQTMIKVTGEQTPAGPGRLDSHLLADSAKRASTLNFDQAQEDEDEDVPLGILAAHGFPNKNRPPSKLISSGSNPNLRGLAQSQVGAGSTAGDPVSRGSLPAFARRLPEDPYFGAGIVNQPHRESLAFHSTPNLLSPSGAYTNHPHHPAGLVGVIAGEERARATRRGSPNMGGNFDLPAGMMAYPDIVRSQSAGQLPNMTMMPGMLSPGDHTQLQMSQQMNQMMHMQMQWMQQIQQLMGNQGAAPGMPMMGPQAFGLARPQSVPLQGRPDGNLRSMSTLSNGMANWNQAMPMVNARPSTVYAPSIAPSERSNIGLASRYRPVTMMQEPAIAMPPLNNRTSTMASTAFRPLSAVAASKQPIPTIRKVSVSADDDDDDDEAGWAEMKAKKDQKQKSWRLRRSHNPLQELHNGA